ncbi:MAG: hypothetical protein ACRYGB_15965 [Janthinobacterium lividum]
MKKTFEELLRENQLKITSARLSGLKLLTVQDAATSQPMLEKVLGKEVDRVTL